MSATHTVHSTSTAAPVLYVAFELGWTTWKMAFTIGAGQPPRVRTVPARCTSFVLSILVNDKLPDRLGKLRQWDNAAVPPALQARILREFERWHLVVR
jgi:hypothetical protein